MSIVDRLAEYCESTDRARVVAEAESWLGTPYAHGQRCKGAGADCLTLLAEVYEAAGVIPRVEIPHYAPDWNLHRDAERYLDGVMEHAREFKLLGPFSLDTMANAEIGMVHKLAPEPGDVAVFKFGRCFAHGVIVTEWPKIIHSWIGIGVIRGDSSQPTLARRDVRFFDPFLK